MQYHWLNKKNNKKLIIFFAGWSFDSCPFEFLEYEDYDVLMFFDYNNCDLAEIPEYENYSLISWSMGVFIAYMLKDSLPKFSKKTAINGTPFPIHNELGIPERTFELTLRNVDTGLRGKFQRNLFKEEKDYEKYLQNPVQRKIPEQAQELRDLKDFISKADISYEKYYDRAIISETDKIVPTKNQVNCWKNRASVIMLDSGHFPFYSFNGWDDILKCN